MRGNEVDRPTNPHIRPYGDVQPAPYRNRFANLHDLPNAFSH